MKKALIFYGGWQGHDPDGVSARFARILSDHGFEVDRVKGTECLFDGEKLKTYSLIVPCVTMGQIDPLCTRNVCAAVEAGTGLAGCHGGMCDAFRDDTDWQFLTGGQWVAHPGNDGIRYTVKIAEGSSPITAGLSDFEVTSEQYYLHIDPAIEVLATTRFPVAGGPHAANKPVDMPVAWTKFWGKGRIFYCSLGHNDALFERTPEAVSLMERGMLWAANEIE